MQVLLNYPWSCRYGRPDPPHAGHTIIVPDEYVVRMLDAEL